MAGNRAELSQWTPQNPLAAMLGRGVNAIEQFARKPFGYDNPPGGMAADVLGLPAISRVLERYGYGQPLTNAGQANVPFLKPDTADAALAAAPMVAPVDVPLNTA